MDSHRRVWIFVFVEDEDKGGLLDGAQRGLVDSFGEELLARLRPRQALAGGQRGQVLLAAERLALLVEYLLYLTLELARIQRLTLIVRVHLEPLALAVHGNVLAVAVVDELVGLLAG